MNMSHFHRQPLFLSFGNTDPRHELFTELAYLDSNGLPARFDQPGVEHAVIRCSCGWRVTRPLFEMYDEPGRQEFFDKLGRAALEHVWPPPATLGELTEWGWFAPEVW